LYSMRKTWRASTMSALSHRFLSYWCKNCYNCKVNSDAIVLQF
jgi:hypothetical protein